MTDCVTFIVEDRSISVGFPIPVGAHTPWSEVEFIPTQGQVSFTLSSIPSDAVSLNMFVNGVQYDEGTDYTASGLTLTWLDVAFVMSPTDKVIIKFQ